MDFALITAPIVGILALLFALYKANSINKVSPGNDRMKEIASYIEEGAMAFLQREYRVLSIFVVALFIILTLAINFKTAICFLVGAIFQY